jgi:beta-carotene 15,15'-dioxygenase
VEEALVAPLWRTFEVRIDHERRKILPVAVLTAREQQAPEELSGAARGVLLIGPLAVGGAIVASLLGQVPSSTPTVPGWVFVAALIALAAGIPHGAVDHLMLKTQLSRGRLIAAGATYLAIAAIATGLILIAPGPAFVFVLAMTVWHFGSGDIEAWTDLTADSARPRGIARVILVIAAGGAPVILPLTSPAALTTLNSLNPELGTWWAAPGTTVVRIVVLTCVVVAFIMLLQAQRPRAAIQLLLLAALGIFVAPLLAFAVYFGLWHALRHTARLALHRDGSVTWKGIGVVTAQGLPALIVTAVGVGVALLITGSFTALAPWLWVGLAVVWGLTVPHMTMVERFDRR